MAQKKGAVARAPKIFERLKRDLFFQLRIDFFARIE
jgi:hypothetical protein